jgi:integrator complex subunit 3
LYGSFLKFILKKLTWISSQNNQFLSGIVFIKMIRLLSENHFMVDLVEPHRKDIMKEIIKDELQIISSLWENKKDNILFIGRELIKNLISIAKANLPEINTIIEEIKKSSHDNTPTYQKILFAPQHFIGLNPYVHIQIPPLLERMLIFVINDVKRTNYYKYMGWLVKKFEITSEMELSIFSDITRFLVTCYSFLNLNKQKGDYTPRWVLLGYILKVCRGNAVISADVKLALFFDWLFYSKEKDHFALIEPGMTIIFNSIRDFPTLTMELLDFIHQTVENFDPKLKSSLRNNVADAFKQAETYQMFILKKFMEEKNITEDIKKVYEVLTKLNVENEIELKKSEEDSNILTTREASLTSSPSPSISISEDLENKIVKPIKLEKKFKTIENEFFIHPSLEELISPITLKNFLNYRNKNLFKNTLDEICSKYLQKLKSQNLQDSKLIKLQPFSTEIYSSFANFYLNIFKEELIDDINDYEKENEPSNKKSDTTLVSLFLLDYLITKFFEKNEKEFQFLVECVKQIMKKFPDYIVRIIYYIVKKYILTASKSKLLTPQSLFTIYSRLCEDKINFMKEKINNFFNICADNLDLETISFFLENGLIIFSSLFTDDYELISLIVNYANISNMNKMMSDISNNKFFLVEKSLYRIINNSLNLEPLEQDKLWNLILAHSLNKMTNFKEFIRNVVAFSKNLQIKNKQSSGNELFRNLIKSIKYNFNAEITPEKLKDYYQLFDFPFSYSENLYHVLSVINIKFSAINVSFPMMFSMLVDEYVRQVDTYQDKLHYIENFLKVMKELLAIDKKNLNKFLLEPMTFNIQLMKNKVMRFSRNLKIDIE